MTLFKALSLFLLMIACAGQAVAAIDVNIDIVGTSSGPSTGSGRVYVERVALSFGNERSSITVAPSSKGLYAKARFKYLGNGNLTARWRVNGQVIAQTSLMLSFGKEVEIRSNQQGVDLPTIMPGRHEVTLELSNSEGRVSANIPTIVYFVADGAKGAMVDAPLVLKLPLNIEVNPSKVYFRWQGDVGFRLYKIEVQRQLEKERYQTVIKAISKTDVYTLDTSQRKSLTSGQYRWRVQAYPSDKTAESLLSNWGSFSVSDSVMAQGLFIQDVQVIASKATGVDVSASVSQRQFTLPKNGLLYKSKSLLSTADLAAGQDYQLSIKVQNTGNLTSGSIYADVGKGGVSMGQFLLETSPGKAGELRIPMTASQTSSMLLENMQVVLLDGVKPIDQASINLVIEPQVRLDAIDFDEWPGSFAPQVAVENRCNNRQVPETSLFARLTGAWQTEGSVPINPQALLEQGRFVFDEQKTVQFTAYVKDQGLGDWFSQYPTCNPQYNSKETTQDSRFPLKFVAHPLGHDGQLNGMPIIIGEVLIAPDHDGSLVSPEWNIPAAGHYLITLNDLSDPADLYATLPGGFPKYLHAAGFVLEMNQVDTGSAIISSNPRQAQLIAQATTSWRDDASEQSLKMQMNNAAVSMPNNPLHARLDGGQITLEGDKVYPLNIQGQIIELKNLTINTIGATADLAYQLPGFSNSRWDAINATFSGKKVGAESITAVNTGKVQFPPLEILNGGEFVARYYFNNEWPDIRLKQDDLALRLAGSTLVIDASKHLNYSDYSDQEGFVGIGFHDALLRLKVNAANDLFSTSHPDSAFIYGQATWLNYSAQGVRGEGIELRPVQQVADFFNQTPAERLSLLKPYGFTLQLNGGEFGLSDSNVSGVDLAGNMQLPNAQNSAVVSSDTLAFQHLHRRDSNSGMNLFKTEQLIDTGMNLRFGSFNYQPHQVHLYIGEEDQAGYHEFPNASSETLATMGHEAATLWREALTQTLTERAGLLLQDGELNKGWSLHGAYADQPSGFQRGAFLVTGQGIDGQWVEVEDQRHYVMQGFSTIMNTRWFKFTEAALTDSFANGQLHVPYPVEQNFAFQGDFDQEAQLNIAADGLTMPAEETWNLAYWQAKLHHPVQDEVRETSEPSLSSSANRLITSVRPLSNLLFDAENQRLVLTGMGLSLPVHSDFGSDEFIALNDEIPFQIDTYILPNGQLSETQITPAADIRFIGQAFDVEAIRFLPYTGNHQPPADDKNPTAQPLVEIKGDVNFSVFGPRQVKIHHTALGAKVPEIRMGINIENGSFGDDEALKVKADLQFVNTYGRDPEALSAYVAEASANDDSVDNPKAFKAFAGKAELVLLKAISIKGLAEAGVHPDQEIIQGEDGYAVWRSTGDGDVGYERLGLGGGVDILKAYLAGVRGMESVTRLGGGVAGAIGVDATGEAIVETAVEATVFVESVALATAMATGTLPGDPVTEIRHAVDNGLATVASALNLLKVICAENADCRSGETLLYIDLASLPVRALGAVAHFDELTPEEVASIGLHSLDVAIPLLQGVDLDQAYNQTGLQALPVSVDDLTDAGLATAHVVVGAARTLVDQKYRLSYQDIVNISQRAVDAAHAVEKVIPEGDEKDLASLAVSLADESLSLVKEFNQGGTVNPSRLGDAVTHMVGVMCQQADSLHPLFTQASLPIPTEHIKPMLRLTAAALKNMPSGNMQGVEVRYLQSLIHTLAQGDASNTTCGNSVALPASVQAMLGIAAHTLEPLKGELKTEARQIAWALQGVNQTLSALQLFGSETDVDVDPVIVTQFQGVLNALEISFNNLDQGLSNDAAIADGQRVLRIAQAIPLAFQDLIETGSPQAAELLDIYRVLLQELDQLLIYAPQLAGNDFSQVDLVQLPLALIDEVQDLSMLNQCQQYGLANIGYLLQMVREVGATKPSIQTITAHSQQIYNNIKACDSTGITARPELDKLMAMMGLLAVLDAENSQNVAAIVKQQLPTLLPILFTGSQSLLAAIPALVRALPIVDFTQDNLTAVLDDSLIKLLNEAEQQTPTAAGKTAIQKAKSIIAHADFNLIGLVKTFGDNGDVTHLRQTRADGSWREVDLTLGVIRQYYPEGHQQYGGGIQQFMAIYQWRERTEEEKQQDLFMSFWNEQFASAEPSVLEYKDDAGNLIMGTLEAGQPVIKITSAVSYGAHTPFTVYIADRMPELADTAESLGYTPELTDNTDDILSLSIGSVLQTKLFSDAAHRVCPFPGHGCIVEVDNSEGSFIHVHSLSDPRDRATWSKGMTMLDTDMLVEYVGRITNTIQGWDPTWGVSYVDGTGVVVLNAGDSSEVLNLGTADEEGISSPLDLADAMLSKQAFMQRTVIQGTETWVYQPGQQQAIHTFGDGLWEIYEMPEALPNGVAIPNPDGEIPLENLILKISSSQLAAAQNDPSPLPEGMTLENGQLTITGENSNDAWSIDTSTGQASLGGVPVEHINLVTNSDFANSSQTVEPLDGGGVAISQSDGSSQQVMQNTGSDLTIHREETADGVRTTTIGMSEFEFVSSYSPADRYQVFYLPSQRPAITPASGVNQALKHQMWLDIFELERQLKIEPSDYLLLQLDNLMVQAHSLGLPANELNDQHKQIAAQALTSLMMVEFKRYDAALSPQAAAEWATNPSASPAGRIVHLQEKGEALGLAVWIHSNNFRQHSQEMLYLAFYHHSQALGDLCDGLAECSVMALNSKINALMAVIDQLSDDTQLAEMFSPMCDATEQAWNRVIKPIITDNNIVVIETDLQLAQNLIETEVELNCGTDRQASVSELSVRLAAEGTGISLAQRVAAMDMEQRITATPPEQRHDFDNDGDYDSHDLVAYYTSFYFRQGSFDDVPSPASTDYPAWVNHLQTLSRLVDLVNSTAERRQSDGQLVHYRENQLVTFRDVVKTKLKTAWEAEWQRRYDDFSDSDFQDLEKLKALASHFEKGRNLNAQIGESLIEMDSDTYLRAKIGGQWRNPLVMMSDQQTDWLENIVWRTDKSEVEVAAALDSLAGQNRVISYLKSTLPDEQLVGLRRLDARVIEELDEDMDALDDAAGRANIDNILDDVFRPITEIRETLARVAQPQADARFRERIQRLLDSRIEWLQNHPDDIELEIKKIILITSLAQGASEASGWESLSGDANVMAALETAQASASLAVKKDNGRDWSGFMAKAKRLINIDALMARLGVEDSSTYMEDIIGGLSPYITAQESLLRDAANQDLDTVHQLIKTSIEMKRTGQELGAEDMSFYDFEAETHALTVKRDQFSACVANHDCTIEDARGYLDLAASLDGLGVEADLSVLDDMISSSPATFPASIKGPHDLPNFSESLGGNGNAALREAIANMFKAMGDSFDMADASARQALRVVIAELHRLAALQGTGGQLNDPLFNAADFLQIKIDTWLNDAAAQIASMVSGAMDSITSIGLDLGDALGEVSMAELEQFLLPQLNGTPDLTRIEPGNKYRLAAQALAEAGLDTNNEANLRLAYRLLSEMPDPDITVEGDYRLAGMGQLIAFMAERGEALVTAVVAVTDNQHFDDRPELQLLGSLLHLPGKDQPAQFLAGELKTQLIEPLLNGGEKLDCVDGIEACLLSSGLQLSAVLIDSLSGVDSDDLDMIDYLATLAGNLQKGNDTAEAVWFSLAGQSLAMTVTAVKKPESIQTQLVVDGLTLGNYLLGLPAIERMITPMPQPLPTAFTLMREMSSTLASQLSATDDQHLPVALARLIQGSMLAGLGEQGLPSDVLNTAETVGNWQLTFIDKNWALVEQAVTGQLETDAVLDAYLGDYGIAALHCRVNEGLGINLPPALSMTPFMTTKSLLVSDEKEWLGKTEHSPKVLAHLGADLSNLWFADIHASNCDAVAVPDLATDQPVAELLRAVADTDLSQGASFASVSLMGNLGIGAINTLLPQGNALRDVMNISWNGKGEKSPGISAFLNLGIGSANSDDVQIVSDALTLIEGVPNTAQAIVIAMSKDKNDPTAKLLRIVSGNALEADLLTGDTWRGDENRAYAIPHSLLALFAEMRKTMPLQTQWAYLETVPFIAIANGHPQLSAANDYVGDMNSLVADAMTYNATDVANGGAVIAQKAVVTGVDLGRLGINGIASLVGVNESASAIGRIQERSLFDDLAGDGLGFSGISGGLQKQWDLNTLTSEGMMLELYGQLAFPFVGRHLGLLQQATNDDGKQILAFSAASGVEGSDLISQAVGGFIGGVEGSFDAYFSHSDSEGLSLSYQGKTGLKILSNTIGEVQVSGLVDDFPIVSDQALPDYALDLVKNIDVVQCGQLEGQVLPFPLSLTGVSGTAKVGAFYDKTDTTLSFGTRIGLSGSLKFPVLNSLLGVTLAGDLTQENRGELIDDAVQFSYGACVNPNITLTVAGQEIPLQGVEVQIASFVEGDVSDQSAAFGLKMRVMLGSKVVKAIKEELACPTEDFNPFRMASEFINNAGEIVLNNAVCTALNPVSKTELWLVLRNGIDDGATRQQMMFGFGEFPAKSTAVSPFLGATFINGGVGLPFISNQSGEWGGLPASQNIRICNIDLCDLPMYEAGQ